LLSHHGEHCHENPDCSHCANADRYPALARKSCDGLKAEIEANIKAKGVKAFTLEIVASNQVKDEKVVGSCDDGTKKITYKRG